MHAPDVRKIAQRLWLLSLMTGWRTTPSPVPQLNVGYQQLQGTAAYVGNQRFAEQLYVSPAINIAGFSDLEEEIAKGSYPEFSFCLQRWCKGWRPCRHEVKSTTVVQVQAYTLKMGKQPCIASSLTWRFRHWKCMCTLFQQFRVKHWCSLDPDSGQQLG